MIEQDVSQAVRSRDAAVRGSVLVELGSPVARIYRDPGRPHLEWVQLFAPTGQYIVLQRDHAMTLARAILAEWGEPA